MDHRSLMAAAVEDVQAQYAVWTLGNLAAALDKRLGDAAALGVSAAERPRSCVRRAWPRRWPGCGPSDGDQVDPRQLCDLQRDGRPPATDCGPNTPLVRDAVPDQSVSSPGPRLAGVGDVLKDQGVAGTLTESRGFWEIIAVYALQSAGLSSALFVGLATLTFGSVLLNGRRYAIWRLHGASPWQISLRDATSLLPYLTSINLGTATAVAGFLLWYNGWSQAAVFAQFTLVAALLMYAVVGGAYMVGLLSMYGTSVLNSLRGRARLIFSRMLLYPIRVVVVLMIASAVAELAGGLGDLANRAAAGPRLAGVGDSVNVTLPGYRTPEDSDRDYAAVGAWLRRMDSNGRVIIIKRDSLQDNINEHLPESGSEILWVNESFLSQYPLLNSSGDSVKSTNGGLVQVIIPERLARYAHAIVENVRLGFTDEALLAGSLKRTSKQLSRPIGRSSSSIQREVRQMMQMACQSTRRWSVTRWLSYYLTGVH